MSSRDIVTEKRRLRIALARKRFWEFCKLLDPDFYFSEMEHLRVIADTLQAYHEDRIVKYNGEWAIIPSGTNADGFEICRKLMINMPPRSGKSRTVELFVSWLLGHSRRMKFVTASYNDKVASEFSRYTRDIIAMTKKEPREIVYSDIFPLTRLKKNDAGVERWAVDGSFFSYATTGIGGTITGKGANYLIIDDPIKDAKTAYSETAMDSIWQWITGTLFSRVEVGGKWILNQTRWPNGDPSERFLDSQPQDWYHLSIPAMNEDGTTFCEYVLPLNEYHDKRKNMDELIFEANYNQKILQKKGQVYKQFNTYTELPKDDEGAVLTEGTWMRVDVADQGTDFLCAIVFDIWDDYLYVKDVLYTDQAAEITEILVADLVRNHNVVFAKFESQSGGAAFARNVEGMCVAADYRSCLFETFHQSENKMSRILTNASNVQRYILMPTGWGDRWPKFRDDVFRMQRKGRNQRDDAPDTLTGCFEMSQEGVGVYI